MTQASYSSQAPGGSGRWSRHAEIPTGCSPRTSCRTGWTGPIMPGLLVIGKSDHNPVVKVEPDMIGGSSRGASRKGLWSGGGGELGGCSGRLLSKELWGGGWPCSLSSRLPSAGNQAEQPDKNCGDDSSLQPPPLLVGKQPSYLVKKFVNFVILLLPVGYSAARRLSVLPHHSPIAWKWAYVE